MINLFSYIRNKLVLNLLAVTLVILIINIISKSNFYGYYNEIFRFRILNILSEQTASLIITTVTGDQKYENRKLKVLYKELQILHLLVLSGSNLIIFIVFISYFSRKDSISYFVFYQVAITTYFCYINFLHPVARAFSFLFIHELLTYFGLKVKDFTKTLFLLVLGITLYILLDFSNSFLLSLIFSLLMMMFGFLEKKYLFKSKLINKYLIFPLYMSAATYPVAMYFFKGSDFNMSLLSNFLIVPWYDSAVFIMYLIYILSFIPLIPDQLLIFLGFFIELLIKFLYFMSSS